MSAAFRSASPTPNPHPVSCGQEAAFRRYQGAPAAGAQNICLFFLIRGQVDTALMQAACDQLLSRHPMLRSVYSENGPTVSQCAVAVDDAALKVQFADARSWSTEALQNRAELDGRVDFDLESGPVFGVHVYSRNENEYGLLLCAHQIAADARSLRIVRHDWEEIYTALSEGRTPLLPPVRATFFDYARRERQLLLSERAQALLEFWRGQLTVDSCVLDLPLDHRRPAGPPSCEGGELRFQLPPDLACGLASLAEKQNATLHSICLTAYATLLSRYGGTQTLFIGSSTNTRATAELQNVVGSFENLAVIPAKCPPQLTFQQLLSQLSTTLLQAGKYSDFPFSVLVEKLGVPLQPGRAPLCDVYFGWEEGDAGLKILEPLAERFDLALLVRSEQNAIEVSFRYRKDLFEPATIDRMCRHFVRLLESIVSSPATSISELEMMPDEERALILGPYAGTSADYPRLCLHELFAEQTALRPDAEALVFGSERLTYRELDRRSNQVARFLRAQGLRHEDLVGIFMERSVNMIVSILGILKAGGAYVPIDPDYPAERLEFMITDTSVRWVLTQRTVCTALPGSATLVYMDDPDSPVAAASANPVPNIATPESIAVLIYTSGSTGQPKGVCIPHRAAVRTVRNTNYLQVTPGDRIAQCASTSFDAAIQEIWSALVNGAALIGIPRETLLAPPELVKLLSTERITHVVLNTAYLHQIGREAPDILKDARSVLFGGEAAEPSPIRNILKHGPPQKLINGYGPAEGCVISTFHEITTVPDDATTVLIGRPVTNSRVYLLDHQMHPVPIGMTGEIYIGGEGVARGYWNRPKLNAERFLPDSFSGRPGALLYRTGDLARMRGNGELEFVGRVDHQVKIRGYRIELPEVQLAVTSHPGVKQAFVMVREDQEGDKRLVAYITLQRELPFATAVLRQYMKDKLPSYMVPAAFVVLDTIPLTTNGKVDRHALPPPHERPDISTDFESPTTDLQRLLIKIWGELLGVEKIGLNDDFFDLGGHSLLATRLISRIEKETGHNIPVVTLFEAPTVAQLARKLEDQTYTHGWAPLVKLHDSQSTDAVNPLFCIHSLGANLVSFHKLTSLLRTNRPVYGLQPHGLDGNQNPLQSVEEMAAAYLQEIRAIQPHGPYYLSGICLGGVIAYEIAQQLHAAGQQVGLLVLIDSFVPGKLKYLHTRSNLTSYLDDHLGELLLLPIIGQVKYLANWIANGGIRMGWAFGWRRSGSLAQASLRVAEANIKAMQVYEPKPYAGKVIQFICSDAPHRAYEDRRLAWSNLAKGGFELHIVPGNHLTMVEEPFVRVVAEKLQFCLDRADGIPCAFSQQAGSEPALQPGHELSPLMQMTA